MELRTLKRVLNSGQRYVPIKMYINPHHEIQSGNGIVLHVKEEGSLISSNLLYLSSIE